MSTSNAVPLSVYKNLLHDMIREETDARFIRQIYSIFRYHQEATAATPPNVGTSKEVKE